MNEQHEQICKTLERLRGEVQWLLESWALFESSNGFPGGGRRKKLIDAINKNSESWAIRTIRLLAIRDTILAMHRMVDYYDGGRSPDRQTLARVAHFLDQKGSLQFLIAEARRWHPGLGDSDYNERLIRELHTRILPHLHGTKVDNARNIVKLKAIIAELRNKTLAHALDGSVEILPRLFDIRDGVVLTTYLVQECSLMIAGTSWDPKRIWRTALRNAQEFWDRYEKGFDSQPI